MIISHSRCSQIRSLSLSPSLSLRELTQNAQGCHSHDHVRAPISIYMPYLCIYGVSQIKRSFAKRPNRPASSELIIATSAYQRPSAIHPSTHKATPLPCIPAKVTQRLRDVSSAFKDRKRAR